MLVHLSHVALQLFIFTYIHLGAHFSFFFNLICFCFCCCCCCIHTKQNKCWSREISKSAILKLSIIAIYVTNTQPIDFLIEIICKISKKKNIIISCFEYIICFYLFIIIFTIIFIFFF